MSDTIPSKPQQKPRSRHRRWSRAKREDQATQPAVPAPRLRCAAAHDDDRSPCEGSPHAVEVVTKFGHHCHGCLWHGTILFASLSQALLYPVIEDPAAVGALRRIAPRLRGLCFSYWPADPDERSQP